MSVLSVVAVVASLVAALALLAKRRSAATGDYGFAGTRGKTVLYKFRPYVTEQDRDRVRQILLDHKVYLARASELNDPFDLAPAFEPASREKLLAGLRGYFERRPGLLEEERAKRVEYFENVDPSEHQRRVEQKVHAWLEEDYWVFSLAGNREHPMLWSHYAGGHTGLCLHFRADEGRLFSCAMAVRYDKERPVVPLNVAELPLDEVAKLTTLRKGEFWEYEEEFRFVRHPHVDYTNFPLRFDGQFAYFDPRELCGLSLGARMPPREVDEICKLATEHAPKLPVWQARPTAGFEFEFVPIASVDDSPEIPRC